MHERALDVQVAFQQADYVAWNVWSSINHRPLLPFKYQHLGEAMSLGAPPCLLPDALPMKLPLLLCVCALICTPQKQSKLNLACRQDQCSHHCAV